MELGLLIGLSLALGVAAWLFFLGSVKGGQYDDPEGAKYRMLEDDDEPPPRAEDPPAPAAPAATPRDPAEG